MNILMLGTDASPFKGEQGGGNTLDRLSRYLNALSAHEPQSTITSLVYTSENIQAFSPSKNMYFIPVRVPKVQFYPFAGVVAAGRIIKSRPPDVITTQNAFEVGVLGIFLQKIAKTPVEIQVHLDFSSCYWLRERPFWNRIRRIIARWVLLQADVVRVVSTPIKTFLVEQWRLPEDKISVIPVPVFYSREGKGKAIFDLAPKSSPLVLFIGRLCYQKNLPALLTIMKDVSEKKPETKFVVIGDGPLRHWFVNEVNKASLSQCKILGALPYNELMAWYRQANVTILPSLYEGFGRVIMESYLQQTPAVATRCGGPEDIIRDGETGFLTAIEDMKLFAERVLWLLEHPTEAREMGERGFLWVKQRFHPDELVERMTGQWLSLKA